jgi:hypothetical protein
MTAFGFGVVEAHCWTRRGGSIEDGALPVETTGTQNARKGWLYKSVRKRRREKKRREEKRREERRGEEKRIEKKREEKRREKKRTGLKTRHYKRKTTREAGLPDGPGQAPSWPYTKIRAGMPAGWQRSGEKVGDVGWRSG